MQDELTSEQREQREQPPGDVPPAARGRPFVKGQSGNPVGRPSRRRRAAVVAEYLICRKTVGLTNKLLELALTGDKTALKLCLDRIAPPRREMPIDLPLASLERITDVRTAMCAVVDAAASGAISSTQANTLARVLLHLNYPLSPR